MALRTEGVRKARDLCIEWEKNRAAGKFTFARLGENEEDLDKLKAWYAKVYGLGPASADKASSL